MYPIGLFVKWQLILYGTYIPAVHLKPPPTIASTLPSKPPEAPRVTRPGPTENTDTLPGQKTGQPGDYTDYGGHPSLPDYEIEYESPGPGYESPGSSPGIDEGGTNPGDNDWFTQIWTEPEKEAS